MRPKKYAVVVPDDDEAHDDDDEVAGLISYTEQILFPAAAPIRYCFLLCFGGGITITFRRCRLSRRLGRRRRRCQTVRPPRLHPISGRQQASEHLALHWGMKLNTEQTGRKMLVQKVRAPRERAVISWQSLIFQRRSFRSFAFSLLGVSLFASLEDLLGVMVGMIRFN